MYIYYLELPIENKILVICRVFGRSFLLFDAICGLNSAPFSLFKLQKAINFLEDT